MEAGVEEARRHVSEGFGAMKLKVGFGVEADVEYVHAIGRPWVLGCAS